MGGHQTQRYEEKLSQNQFSKNIFYRDAKDEDSARYRLKSMTNCSFQNMSSYLQNEKNNRISFPRNSKLWRWCRSGFNCWKKEFLQEFCKLFPVTVFKIVRLPLRNSEYFLRNKIINKVLLLVRDPRYTMESRLIFLFSFPPQKTINLKFGQKIMHTFTNDPQQ